jgi:tetratricopeptide (TPR) repeat protein
MSKPKAITEIAEDFSLQLRLARASELALLGYTRNLSSAVKILAPDARLPESVPELDLLARIFVRAGRYKNARKCWRKAQRISGENEDFQYVLDSLDEYVLKLDMHEKNKRILMFAGIILWALFLVFVVFFII